MKVYQKIASAFQAWQNSRERGSEWESEWESRIESWAKAFLPSGSGFDAGTIFDFDESKTERLVFHTSYHHMNESGSYDGWTEHSVIVTPSLAHGFNIRITGKNRNDIKDYIADFFEQSLNMEFPAE